ncbi:MAG: sigma-70 family RNA polymerase sigma factor [Deltaproteobacteria bacterium]|nr:sigma-70 family RNA polymerase sigma factor [Deltaproteobacteria bacterium]
MNPIPKEVTEALALWNEGGANAAEELLPLVYGELRRLARGYLNKQHPGHTLQPTALVHEAYLRLADKQKPPWKDRVHFYAVSAKIMRGILVDHARAHRTAKRGGDFVRVTLEESLDSLGGRGADLIDLDDALKSLAAFDARKSQIIELRFFGGLTLEETSQLLGISAPTVVNETRRARAWLYREIAGPVEESRGP